MALRGTVRMSRQVSEPSKRLQVGGSSVFCWIKAIQPLLGNTSQNVLKALSMRRRASLLALGTEAPLLLGLFFLQSMKDAFAQQRKARFTIPLSFDQFQLSYLPFDHAVIDPPG
jgi:hypothetical protein